MFETSSDAVDVIIAYEAGRVRPLRFRWQGRVVRVKQVSGEWSRREGHTVLRYYAVEGPASDTYELCYDPRGPRWMLSRVWNGTP